MITNKYDKFIKVIPAFIILAGAVFLIWRAPYGYFFNDEPFCLTIAQRLSFGDMLISEEWNACQNIGILLLPFYKLFHIFSESNDGILLVFRYIYCFFWFATCLFVYTTLSRNYKSAIIVFAYLVLFSPLDYMTMSYTSISLMSCLTISTLFYFNLSIKRINPLLFSILFSFFSCTFVLCYPYLAAVYCISFILLVVILCRWRNVSAKYDLYCYWKYFLITSVILIFAAASLYIFFYILKGIPISNILRSVPFIFSSPEHNNITSFGTVLYGIKRILTYSRLYTLLIAGSIIYWIIGYKYKKLRKYKFIVFTIVCIYYIRCQYNVCTGFDNIEYNTLNQQILGIVYLGILAYILLDQKPKILFLCYVPLSFAYACLASISSNTGMLVIAMALCVSGVPSIIFISLLCRETYLSFGIKLKYLPIFVFSIVMTMQISSELYVRLTRFYWDEPMSEITEKISVGSGKGIYTSKKYYDEYTDTYEALNYLLKQCDNSADKHFLSLTAMPVLYLDADLPYGIYSSWSFRMTSPWLETYYSINPDREAELIFSDSESDEQFADYFDINNYSVMEYNGYRLYIRNDN